MSIWQKWVMEIQLTQSVSDRLGKLVVTIWVAIISLEATQVHFDKKVAP